MFLTALFILLMQDSKLAKAPSSICMPQVQIRSLQNQLFMSFNPIMLKAFQTDTETPQTSRCREVRLCVRMRVRARTPCLPSLRYLISLGEKQNKTKP